MAAIVWTNGTDGVADAFPELVSMPGPFQTIALSIVNGTGLATNNFDGEDGPMTKAARQLYAAHIATLARRRGVGGAIASQSEGGVSQSYTNSFANPRALDLTSYGQILRGMIAGTPARAGALI